MAPSRTAVSPKCELTLQREKAKSVFSSINRYRASKKIPVLTWDDTIYSYCVLHNIDMHSSTLKSSKFSLGYGYNENVAHFPGSAKKVVDIWQSHSNEKENMLFDSAKYSAIAVYGNENECYATQIFMEHRPKKNDKVVSMKTQKKCDTCRGGYSMASKSSGGFKARSVASTKLRTKKVSSSAKKGGASSRHPATRSAAQRSGLTSKPSFLHNIGNIGQSIRHSITSGVKSLGEALDDALPFGDHSTPRAQHNNVACKGGRCMSSPHSLPYTFDRGSRPRPTRRLSIPGKSFSRVNRSSRGFGSDSFEDCPYCKSKKSRGMNFCDTCSTYM